MTFFSAQKSIRNWYYIKYKNTDYEDYIRQRNEEKFVKKMEAQSKKQHSFIGILFSRLHEKTCFRVEFK